MGEKGNAAQAPAVQHVAVVSSSVASCVANDLGARTRAASTSGFAGRRRPSSTAATWHLDSSASMLRLPPVSTVQSASAASSGPAATTTKTTDTQDHTPKTTTPKMYCPVVQNAVQADRYAAAKAW